MSRSYHQSSLSQRSQAQEWDGNYEVKIDGLISDPNLDYHAPPEQKLVSVKEELIRALTEINVRVKAVRTSCNRKPQVKHLFFAFVDLVEKEDALNLLRHCQRSTLGQQSWPPQISCPLHLCMWHKARKLIVRRPLDTYKFHFNLLSDVDASAGACGDSSVLESHSRAQSHEPSACALRSSDSASNRMCDPKLEVMQELYYKMKHQVGWLHWLRSTDPHLALKITRVE